MRGPEGAAWFLGKDRLNWLLTSIDSLFSTCSLTTQTVSEAFASRGQPIESDKTKANASRNELSALLELIRCLLGGVLFNDYSSSTHAHAQSHHGSGSGPAVTAPSPLQLSLLRYEAFHQICDHFLPNLLSLILRKDLALLTTATPPTVEHSFACLLITVLSECFSNINFGNFKFTREWRSGVTPKSQSPFASLLDIWVRLFVSESPTVEAKSAMSLSSPSSPIVSPLFKFGVVRLVGVLFSSPSTSLLSDLRYFLSALERRLPVSLIGQLDIDSAHGWELWASLAECFAEILTSPTSNAASSKSPAKASGVFLLSCSWPCFSNVMLVFR